MNKGFAAVFSTIIGGLLVSAILNGMAHLLPFWAQAVFTIAFLIGDMAFVFSMPKWGLTFTLGWLFGAFIFLDSGILSGWGIMLWIVAPIGGLLAKAQLSSRL